jgi:hypothetical protein
LISLFNGESRSIVGICKSYYEDSQQEIMFPVSFTYRRKPYQIRALVGLVWVQR